MASAIEGVGAGAVLAAEVFAGGGRRPSWSAEAVVTRLGERTMDVAFTGPAPSVDELDDVDFVWVEVQLPGGAKIRPLGELVTVSNGAMTVRFKHLFPDHRASLMGYRTPVGEGLYAVAR